VAFITGGTSGIGRASARLIAQEGAKVVVADLNENADAIADIAAVGTDVRFIRCNVGDPKEVEAAVAETVAAFGSLDVAFNNAGIADPGQKPIHEKTIAEWQKVVDVDLSGVFYGMKYQIAQMRKQATGGSIVNVGSIMSRISSAGIAGYVASKHGLIGLTKTAALENATNNIRVNAIGPGYINTPIVPGIENEEIRAYMASLHPMNRVGEPEEIAKVFLFFASSDASFCTGAYLPVDGGYLCK